MGRGLRGVVGRNWCDLVCGIRGLGGLSVWLMASEPRSLGEGCPEILGCLRQQPGLVDAFTDVNVDGAQGVSQWWWRGRVVCGKKRGAGVGGAAWYMKIANRSPSSARPFYGVPFLLKTFRNPSCPAGLPLYMLLPAVQRLKITWSLSP